MDAITALVAMGARLGAAVMYRWWRRRGRRRGKHERRDDDD